MVLVNNPGERVIDGLSVKKRPVVKFYPFAELEGPGQAVL
jgi:hypothetical protein